MALLEVCEVSRQYREGGGTTVQALRGVTLTLTAGEFACLAGPSGSGKTTLLNLIGALDKPTAGRILYEGRDLTAIPISRLAAFRLRHIGFIFQAYNLINTLTALENTEYVMLLQGRRPSEARAEAAAVLERVGLGAVLHRRASRLSGGQQQRVAVARALAGAPKVILADEPTANLDSATARDLLALMRSLNRERGATFLFSTHDPMVMDACDRIIRMRDGALLP